MLYHITNVEKVESIREQGLIPANYPNAVDPFIVAEETRDRLLDKEAKQKFGSEYASRRDSVFFYSDSSYAISEANTHDSAVVVVDESELITDSFFRASISEVESLFQTIKNGVEKSLTNPEYNKETVEKEALRIVEESFQKWNETGDSGEEIWGVGRVPSETISDIWMPESEL